MAAQAKPGVQERILLHLLDYSDFKDSIEVPFALSQMGIANAVAIARSNVPRAIAGLKEQGILVERQAHVKGVSRKRKAYFLTDSGVLLASETWEQLSEFPVTCVLDEQPAVSTTLGSAKSVLPFEMRPVDIIRYIDEHNRLDVRNLSADLVERDLVLPAPYSREADLLQERLPGDPDREREPHLLTFERSPGQGFV